MASIYQRPKSPFWWIKYRGSDGAIHYEATPFRWSMVSETKKAKELKAQKAVEELQTKSLGRSDTWAAWVPQFLERRYHGSPKSLKAMAARWRMVERYFTSLGLTHPQQVDYRHCLDYMAWRRKPENTGYFAGTHKTSRNTAIHELKALGMVLQEAVNLKIVQVNVCTKLGLKKDKPAPKPEITYEQEALIRKELLKEPEWMRIAFEIGIHQGCRLSECAVPLQNINRQAKTISLHIKGGRLFTTSLHPSLTTLVENAFKKRKALLCEMPALPSKHWFTFFKRIGLGKLGYCFHCTRVTVITRLARAGVPEVQARRYVGHSSQLCHQIYQRLSPGDLQACVNALQAPAPCKPLP